MFSHMFSTYSTGSVCKEARRIVRFHTRATTAVLVHHSRHLRQKYLSGSNRTLCHCKRTLRTPREQAHAAEPGSFTCQVPPRAQDQPTLLQSHQPLMRAAQPHTAQRDCCVNKDGDSTLKHHQLNYNVSRDKSSDKQEVVEGVSTERGRGWRESQQAQAHRTGTVTALCRAGGEPWVTTNTSKQPGKRKKKGI